MVRLKNRYLLIDILYPDPATWPSSNADPKAKAKSTPAQLAIHSPTSDALTPGLLAKMVREQVSDLYGDWGVGKTRRCLCRWYKRAVKYLSPATSTIILRCPRASFRLVWSALTYMSHVPANGGDAGQKRPNGGRERACVFRVLRVSGTMKKAQEDAIQRARREIVRVRGVEEKGVLGSMISGDVDGEEGQGAAVQSIVDQSEDEMAIDDD
ncbi:hypothetical protein N7478_012970 [Penicillium angulare]|uniref:uncharacterized protein n=1 Tax=Penicillium angulare TaxID=116970 RepID=UPI002540BCB9|nr:uncharacterized protein N7478_012970 [Penicillium angulare]KAJ5256866.1 hypothetical protein N7478_012970 [Penicillium angulare]